MAIPPPTTAGSSPRSISSESDSDDSSHFQPGDEEWKKELEFHDWDWDAFYALTDYDLDSYEYVSEEEEYMTPPAEPAPLRSPIPYVIPPQYRNIDLLQGILDDEVPVSEELERARADAPRPAFQIPRDASPATREFYNSIGIGLSDGRDKDAGENPFSGFIVLPNPRAYVPPEVNQSESDSDSEGDSSTHDKVTSSTSGKSSGKMENHF
jgi:hypothetical protein